MRKFLFFLSFVLILNCSNSVNPNHDAEVVDENSANENSVDQDLADEKKILTDLKVEENPENVLSCRLSFKTDDRISTVVRYHSDIHSGYELRDEDKDDHYFFLWGMRAETKYDIDIFLNGNEEEPFETLEFTTGKLPESVPPVILRKNDPLKTSEGFVLFTYYYIPEDQSKPIAVMLDAEGKVVWYFEYYMSGFNVIGDVQYIDETSTILMSLSKGPNMADIPAEEAIEIDLEGSVIWKSHEILSVHNGPNSWHHIYDRVSDNSLVMLKPEIIGNVVSDKVLNLDREYNELWSWKYSDHFEVPECPASEICDWTHSNHVNMYPDERTAYLNSRNFSSLFRIDMDTGEIVWTFGKDGDFTMISDHPDPWFEFGHAPKLSGINRNEILFYDNGSDERGYSRVIKYRIDEEAMTAEVIFEFDGSKIGRQWFTPFWGDVDNMDNGNIVVTAGNFENQEESRIFEITPDGEIVWEIVLVQPQQEDMMISLYNSCKFKSELLR